jgi:metal-dependent HD superfamily phosphatase/phosphodiesterase
MKPIKIQIGSLKKYAEIFKIENLLEIKIEPKK